MTRVMYTTGDRPFELVDIYYRADKYHYSVNLSRVKRNGRWEWSHEPRGRQAAGRRSARAKRR